MVLLPMLKEVVLLLVVCNKEEGQVLPTLHQEQEEREKQKDQCLEVIIGMVMSTQDSISCSTEISKMFKCKYVQPACNAISNGFRTMFWKLLELHVVTV